MEEEEDDTVSMNSVVPSFLLIIWRTRKVSLSCPLIGGGDDGKKAFLGIKFTEVKAKI